jgi:ABC-type transport system involved in multi-copper enzyme maturation permease subunit
MSAPITTELRQDFSAPRVKPNQRNAFGGVWRLTFRRWLSLNQLLATAGLLVVLAGILGASVSRADASAYFDWTGDFFVGVVVPVLAFLSGAGAMRDDMKPGAVDYLFTRPVRRTAFVVFRYLSHLACTQLSFLLAFGVLVAVGVFREIPGLAAGLPLLLLAQVLTIAAFSALGFLCAVLVSRYLVIGLLYAGIIEAGVGQIPTQLSRLSMTRQIRELLEPVMLGVSDGFSAGAALSTTGLMLVFSAAFVVVAAVVFSMKELAGAAARE